MSRHFDSSVRRRAWVLRVLATAAASGMLFTWWLRACPAEQVRQALAALRERDWERLEYQHLSVPRTQRYAPARALFGGALKLEQGEIASALRDFRHAAADPAIRPLAWVLAGEALYAQNRFRDAKLNFEHALELDPDLLEAHSWLAIVDYDIGLMQQAAWHLQRVAELDPHDPRPHRMMAVIHLGFGSHAIAIEDFQESLRRDPNQVDRQEMLVELAQAQLWMRRFADAARTLSQCDETAEVLAMRADGLFGVGRKADARRLAEAALVIEPRQRLALLVLGRLEFDNLRYQQAVELFSRAAEAAPGDYEIHYSYLMALRAAGHTEQVNQELAVVEELRELRERFDELLARATTEPQNANVRYELGVIADRLEMTEVAQSWFKAAVGLDPQHHLARHELNALRFKNNRPHRGGPASP